MKRCPQCEFIYEDDQSLCDMDGALLVFDARTLPNLHALAPVQVPDVPVATPRAYWRHRTFPAMAALILASVLSLVYFVTTQRGVRPPAPVSDGSVATPLSNSIAPADTSQPPSDPGASGALAVEAPKEEAKASESPKVSTNESSASPGRAPAVAPAAPATAKKGAVKVSATTQPKPAPEPKKEDDSKVGSILKKTGRILKKPFKF